MKKPDSKHTPEPWEATAMSYYYCDECNEEFQLHAIALGCEHEDELRGWDLKPKVFVVDQGDYFALNRANAARIVACVNALAGLNPEAVRELVKAAKLVDAADEHIKVLRDCFDPDTGEIVYEAVDWGKFGDPGQPYDRAIFALRAALAKLEGKIEA